MSSLAALAAFGRVAAVLPAFLFSVGAKVAEALEDGRITPAEAETFARQSSAEAGDLVVVKVRGVDIVGPDAQADLAAFVGRVTARLVAVLTT